MADDRLLTTEELETIRAGRWGMPEWAEDRIYSHTNIVFSWRDRFRLLLTGKCWLEVKTTVEHAPGRMESTSQVHVLGRHWPWQRRGGLGYAEMPERR